MATLEELYQKHMHTMRQGSQAFGQAAMSPIQTGVGALKGIGKVVTGLGSTLLDIPQAFMPTGVTLPGASSGAIVPEGTYDPKWSAEGQGNPSALPEWKQRLGLVANAMTLGLGRSVADTYKQTGSIDQTVFETAKDMLPVHEITAVVSGESRSRPGELMTPEEYGENLVHGFLKAIPAAKGLLKASSRLRAGVRLAPEPRTALSATELAEGKTNPMDVLDGTLPTQNRVSLLAAERQAALDIRNKLPKNALPEEKLAAAENLNKVNNGILTELGLKNDIIKQAYGKISQSPEAANAFVDSVLKLGEADAKIKPITELIVDTMGTPGGRQSIMEILEKYDVTPEQIAPYYTDIMDALRTKTTGSGKVLKAASDAQRQLGMSIENAFHKGEMPAEKYNAFKSLQKALDLEDGPVTMYQKLVNKYRNMAEIWRGAAVSSPVTSARNAQVGIGVFASQLFDSTMLGLESYAAGKFLKATGKIAPEEAATFSEAMAKPYIKIAKMQEMLLGGEKTFSGWLDYMTRTAKEDRVLGPISRTLDTIASEYPTELTKMMTGAVNDLNTINLMADGLKGAPQRFKAAWKNVETPMDAARFGVSVINTLNTTQELFWRKYFFSTRLQENLREFGYKNPEEFINKLKEDKGLGPQYFGKAYDAASLDHFINNNLKSKLNAAATNRLSQFQAQTGEALHKAEIQVSKSKQAELAELANKQLAVAKVRLESGEDWYSVAKDLKPEVAKLIEGEIHHPSEIITDAADHAMKSTFAYTPPKGNLGHALLDVYDRFPFLYTLGSPFPRFAINSVNWIFEHNPLDLANVPIAHPNFLKTLNNLAKNPKLITDRHVLRQFEQAHTGSVLWAGARALANSDLKGPKYYQIKAGEDERGNPIFADMRPYQPFVQYMFMDQVAHDMMNNRVPNLTAAELTEAVTGMRRLSEVPIFAFSDIIRQVDSSSPEAFTNSLKTLMGQTVAAAFTPFRTIGDVAGAVGVDSAVTQKDVSGNELLGPSINQIPILREMLPNRSDPFTGEIAAQQYPGIRMLGPSLRSVTQLEQEVSKTGIPLNDLLGNYSDPEADRLVRKYVGQILGRTTADNKLIADRLGEVLAQVTTGKPNEFRNTMVREMFTEVRQQALQMAMAENPFAFIEHAVRQRPEAERPILRDALKKYKAESVRRQIQNK